ncbi:MAG: phosphotransferase [Pseudomonadota bacterium]
MSAVRDEQITGFLSRAGWADANIRPLAGDASNRRYLRLDGPAGRAVLMDAPPDTGEDTAPFINVTRWLRDQQYSAPAIRAADIPAGLLLLEDLGDALYAVELRDKPEEEQRLYAAAVDLLANLAQSPPPPWAPPYDQATLDREAALFAEWWLPAAGVNDPKARDNLLSHVYTITSPLADCRDVMVLRDYHAENLVWLPDRDLHERVGLLDYQDALAGHPAYDLVSLLEDARRDTSDALQKNMLERYLSARRDLDPDAFMAAYAALGAQRNLKIIGIFARLALRDGKARYLDLIPRVWAHLLCDLEHPNLSALRTWILSVAPTPDTALLQAIAGRSSP